MESLRLFVAQSCGCCVCWAVIFSGAYGRLLGILGVRRRSSRDLACDFSTLSPFRVVADVRWFVGAALLESVERCGRGSVDEVVDAVLCACVRAM